MLLGFPFIVLVALVSKKRRSTCLPRLGMTRAVSGIESVRPRTDEGKAIWVHALSVGETRLAASLVRGLRDRFEGRRILFSVSTQTGFDVAKGLLDGLADDIFLFPYDIPWSIKRVADRIDPAIVLIVESDIWPNFLSEMKQRGIPVILCNGRLSNRSFSRYRRLPHISKFLFSYFAMIGTPSEGDAKRFAQLGIHPDNLCVTGNLKFDQDVVSVPSGDVKERKRALKLPPTATVLLAGSTHRGEEMVLFDAFMKLVKENPDLRLIIAPRDPARAGSIERIAGTKGLSSFSMTAIDEMAAPGTWDVMIVDTIGVLSRIYALADIAFIGGSLVAAGGHNPLEPAAFSKPILFGPDMSDFRDIAQMLLCSGGAIRVEDADDICREISSLLGDIEKVHEMGARAFRVFSDNGGAVERTLTLVEDCLHYSVCENNVP